MSNSTDYEKYWSEQEEKTTQEHKRLMTKASEIATARRGLESLDDEKRLKRHYDVSRQDRSPRL